MLLYGVNDRFRFCRYHAGEKFEAHTDDVYRNADATLVSMLTLVIYLNDDYDGGNLNYLSARFPSSAATAASRDNIVKTVVPQVGLAVCFAHSLLHEVSECHCHPTCPPPSDRFMFSTTGGSHQARSKVLAAHRCAVL